MSQVFDRLLVEIVPTLARRTQSDYQGYIERLRPSFGLTAPKEVTAPDIFEFRAALLKESENVQANRHISGLSAVFREAIGWRQALGPHAVATNPCQSARSQRPEDDADGLREEASACAGGQKSKRVSGRIFEYSTPRRIFHD